MPHDNKIRIVKSIKNHHPHLSQTTIRHMLEEGLVQINGRVAKEHDWVEVGDKLEIAQEYLAQTIEPNPNLNCQLL